MSRLIPFRTAAWALLVLLGAACVFQLVVFAGYIPTEMVWGGRLNNPEERSVGAIVSLTFLLMMIAVVLVRMRIIGKKTPWIGHYGAWVITLLFVLNTVGNLFALDQRETLIFTPITAISALLAWRVALGADQGAVRRDR